MRGRILLAILIAVALSFATSCAPKQTVEARHPEAEPAEEYVSTEPTEEIAEEPEEEPIIDERTCDEAEKVAAEAQLLRAEGLKMADAGDLEQARDLLDEALNTILGSGLAPDAYPELAQLFLAISIEAINIDEQITLADADQQEGTLADELENIDTGQTEGEEEEKKAEETPPEITYDLPVVLNAKVRYFIETFQTTKHAEIAAGIARSGRYIDMFRRILAEEGVPTDLVYLAMIESTYKENAYSRARAKGIWQFMSWTGKRYGLKIDYWIDERSDPEKSCRAAARYLRDLYNDLGDWLLAMAAYNGGPGRVGSAVRRTGSKDFWTISSSSSYLRRETRNFVPSILAVAIIMKQPEKYGFGDVVLADPVEYEKVKVESPTDLRIAAELANVPVETLQALNPALRRMITPAEYPGFELKLPSDKKDIFVQRFAALPESKRLKYTEHIVRKGETLSAIAKRYRTSVVSIQKANSIANPHRLKLGQHLIVPLSPTYPGAETTTVAESSQPVGTKVTHTVRRGENLYYIARSYRTTIGSICSWNNLDPRATIHPGKKLTLYVGKTTGASATEISGDRIVHNVRQGDTLYDIANRYNISVTQLKRWNNLRRNLIRPGDRLTIYKTKPGGSSSN